MNEDENDVWEKLIENIDSNFKKYGTDTNPLNTKTIDMLKHAFETLRHTTQEKPKSKNIQKLIKRYTK